MLDNKEDKQVVDKEELEERERLYREAIEVVRGFGLVWSFRSIEYLVRKEGITLNQLRSCAFVGKDGDVGFDVEQGVKYIIASGLISPSTCTQEDYNMCMNKAYEIMDTWREEFGFIGVLHILLINEMESKHFFMGAKDLKIIEHLAYKNLQGDLAMNSLAVDLNTKILQSQAIQS